MSKKKSKYSFTISNLSIEDINKKYGIKCILKKTKIIDLDPNRDEMFFSYLDESKLLHKCNILTIDYQEKKFNTSNCFWCRHNFDTCGIGCPISFVPNVAVKRYKSHITKDVYTIKESINKLPTGLNNDIRIIKKGYYETDGIFCSFNCCLSFIKDNKNNSLYDLSEILLHKIYNEVLESTNKIISPAPSWRLLTLYGGYLSIDKFRQSFNTVEYCNHGSLSPLPKFVSNQPLYEEKLKF